MILPFPDLTRLLRRTGWPGPGPKPFSVGEGYRKSDQLCMRPGPTMTLGSAAAAAGVRLIVRWKECQHQVEPDPAEMAARQCRRSIGACVPAVTAVEGGRDARYDFDVVRTGLSLNAHLAGPLRDFCANARWHRAVVFR